MAAELSRKMGLLKPLPYLPGGNELMQVDTLTYLSFSRHTSSMDSGSGLLRVSGRMKHRPAANKARRQNTKLGRPIHTNLCNVNENNAIFVIFSVCEWITLEFYLAALSHWAWFKSLRPSDAS